MEGLYQYTIDRTDRNGGTNTGRIHAMSEEHAMEKIRMIHYKSFIPHILSDFWKVK